MNKKIFILTLYVTNWKTYVGCRMEQALSGRMKIGNGDGLMARSRSKQFLCLLILLHLLMRSAWGIALAPGEVLAPEKDQIINIPVQSEIGCLEPDQAVTFWQYYILDMVLEPLVRFEAARRIVPAGATYWEASPDGTVWCFYLRPDAKWSNGDSVTAHDFVRTYQNYCDPDIRTKICRVFSEGCPLKNALRIFERALPIEALGVKALDEYTLELTFERPMEEKALLNGLTHPMFAPVHLSFLDAIRRQQTPSHTYRVRHHAPQSHTDGQYLKDELHSEASEAFNHDPFISNGPFTITALQFGTRVQARKNRHYWDAKNIALQKVNWYFTHFTPRDFWKVAIEENRWNLACLDNAPACPRDLHPKLFGVWGTQSIAPSTRSTQLFVLNTRSEKLKDLQVRRALDILLNRKGIVEGMIRQHSPTGLQKDPAQMISYSLVPRNANYGPEYRPDFADWPEARRREEGEALLHAAGYTVEQPLNLAVSLPDCGKSMRAFFESMGPKLFISPLVSLDLELAKHAEGSCILRQEKFDIMLKRYTYLGEIPEAVFRNCKSAMPLGFYAGLGDAQYDEWVNAAIEPVVTADCLKKRDRYALLRGAEKKLMDQHALLPVWHPKTSFVAQSNVRGLANADHPIGYPDLRAIYLVANPPMASQCRQPERDEREIWRLNDQIEILFSGYPSFARADESYGFGARRVWTPL